MLGIIDVGGGERDIYGAGIFDRWLEMGVRFDYAIGVSAGSANLASFLAGQKGRNYTYYTEYAFRREYMSLGNWLKTGNYLDLDYVYGTTANRGGENPLDFEAMRGGGVPLTVVATDAETGEPKYFTMEDVAQDEYGVMKCSSCVPVVNRPYPFQGRRYFDGGIADPVPLARALADGCDRLVLILTRPVDYRRDPAKDRRMAFFMRRYPRAAAAMRQRSIRYNAQVEEALALQRAGKLLILAPDDIGRMKTLTKDREQLETLYQKGRKDAERITGWL